MKTKLATKMGANAESVMEIHAPALYAKLGSSRVGIVEIVSTERTEVANHDDDQVSVTLRIRHLELASPAAEDDMRRALKALFTQRTAYGTMTEDLDVELSQTTIEKLAGDMVAVENARLRVAQERASAFINGVLTSAGLNASELRAEFRKVGDLLHNSAHGLQD